MKRPRRVLSSNGKQVLNIWFIPHPSELMHLFRNLDEDSKNKACLQMCTIVSAVSLCIHDNRRHGTVIVKIFPEVTFEYFKKFANL